MRRALFNLHLWTAMIAGVLLVILGVTGALLAFEPQIDHLLNPGLFYVQPQAQSLPVSDLLADLRKAFPNGRVSMLMLSPSPDISTYALVRGFSAYIDPHTGRILGTRKGGGVMQTVHDIHRRLLIGQTGEYVMSAAAIVLVFLAISGLILWWPLKRVTISGVKPWRRLNFETHHVVGFYSSLFVLILSITGVMIGLGDYTVPLMYSLTKSEPTEGNDPSEPSKDAKPISPDRAVEIAQSAIPGASLVSVMLPRARQGFFRIGLRFPEDETPGGRGSVQVDQFTGEILFQESSRTAPAGTRLVNLNRNLHTGAIGGWPTKILACLMSLAVVGQAFTGVVMWWKRRPSAKRPAPIAEKAAI